jgi:hypothetical protein
MSRQAPAGYRQHPAARIGTRDTPTPSRPGRASSANLPSPVHASALDSTGIRRIMWAACGPHVW